MLRAGLPGRLILGGAVLVIVGWLGNVTIGAWYLDAGVLTISLVLLVLLLARAEADPDQPMHLPVPVAFVAIVLAGLAALGAVGQTLALADEDLGMDDWLAHLIAVAGVVARARRRGTRRARDDQGGNDAGDRRPLTGGSTGRIARQVRRRPAVGAGRRCPPYRSATTSARIASAVSAGARPPRSRPTGPRSRASSSSVTPASRRRARRSPCVFFDPTAPT